ncbi:multidrug resistance-associated protein 1-like [Biomphalaria glabrata]|uniref:Multidrug resistance-associated protein 1-like n=2 Tax=Biomphalaria glabrata TaxID=6526 RepID=A0A9W3AX29_BIOGL|nr:multidrug resistance-associated protein 1-like [Biomphalaria glabrata]
MMRRLFTSIYQRCSQVVSNCTDVNMFSSPLTWTSGLSGWSLLTSFVVILYGFFFTTKRNVTEQSGSVTLTKISQYLCAILLAVAATETCRNSSLILTSPPALSNVTLMAAVTVVCLLIGHFSRRQEDNRVKAKDEATFLNDIYLNQAISLVKIGFTRELQENDVPDVSEWEKCCQIYQPFEAHWKHETNEKKSRKTSLVVVLLKTFGFKYLTLQFFLCLLDLTYFLNPLVIEYLMKHVENQSSASPYEGCSFMLSMFIVCATSAVLYNRVYFSCMRMSRRIRVSLRLAVFNKALTMTNESRSKKTTGKLISLITEDCDKITDASTNIYYFLMTPCKVLLSMFMLYRLLGYSTLYGMVILLAVIPIKLWAGNKIMFHEEVRDKIKDDRIKVLNEIFNGIKVLKLYAWEKAFISRISKIRNSESAAMKKMNFWCMLLEMQYRAFPLLVQVISFSGFMYLGGQMTSTTALVASSLFGLLYSAFNSLSYVLPNMLQSRVSIKRLSKFLHQEDIPEDIVTKETNLNCSSAIKIVDGTLTWQTSSQKMTLTNINMTITEGSLVAVVGMVGMGKSSLLSAILGEMQKLKGNVMVKGQTAYVPQEAWVQNMSLKENILFGAEYQEQKYHNIIHACALTEDLNILPAGDKTEIGERGINLSGGQKQRISLARSVYSDADIYLLDDPLSAVDSHVGKHIFNCVIGPKGLLKNKTRVLVTHGVHWLPFVDEIIVVKDGRISEAGSYQQLLENNGDFSQFLQSTLNSNNNNKNSMDKSLTCQESNLNNFKDRQKLHKYCDELNLKTTCVEDLQDNKNIGDLTKNALNDEDRDNTKISSKIYHEYLKAIGFKNFCLISFVFIVWLIFKDGKELWLGKWAEDSSLSNTALHQSSLSSMNYLITYVMIGSSGILFSSLFLYLVQTKALDAANRLHNQLLHNILRAPMSFFDTTPTGRIISRFSKDILSIDGLGGCLEEYLRCSGAVLMQLSVLLYLNPRVIPFVLLITCIFLYLQHLFSKTARKLRHYRNQNSSPIIDFFKETIHGLSTIRAFGAQQRFVSRMHTVIENHLKFDVWEMFVGIWFDNHITVMSYVVVLACGLIIVCTGHITPAEAGLILMYSSEFVYSLGWYMTHSTYTEQELVSLERVLEYSNKPVEAEWEIPETRPQPLWPQNGEVIFNDYKARYRDGLDFVLRGISCHVRKGEKIGVVGRTGAGKSSLMSSLFRLMEAAEGQILLDDCNISVVGLHDLRKKITILPQDPVIFGGSIRMNLDPLEEKSVEELWEALKHSHLKTFVESLPGNLDYNCGEGGQNFSMGQRQLLCLARALLHKTTILVLDEATASVDMETDDLIQKTICTEFKDCTVLTIAHRINTILNYDRILVLDNGQVKEFDSPKTLLKNIKSTFFRLAKDAGLVS